MSTAKCGILIKFLWEEWILHILFGGVKWKRQALKARLVERIWIVAGNYTFYVSIFTK